MGIVEEGLIRLCLTPKVISDLPGRLRISYPRYKLLPKEALPYLHYAQDAMKLLPGVIDVQLNLRIGTVLITYAAPADTETIFEWYHTLIDTGFKYVNHMDWTQMIDEKELVRVLREHLEQKLRKRKDGVKNAAET